MESGFSYEMLEGLQDILNKGDPEENDGHVFGSALNPSTLHTGGKKDEKKEIAKPNAQVEVKTFNRAQGGGAPQEAIEKAREALKKANPKN